MRKLGIDSGTYQSPSVVEYHKIIQLTDINKELSVELNTSNNRIKDLLELIQQLKHSYERNDAEYIKFLFKEYERLKRQ